MLSRVLGLAREMMFAGLFGGSRWMDCFYLAFRVPNLLRDLFAEGALSQAFVTTFTKRIHGQGDDSAWKLANKVMTMAAILMSIITVIGVITAPWMVDLLTILAGSGPASRPYDHGEIELTVTMVRVMYPFILLVSLSALVMGMLNAKHVFGMPALSSCFFNLGSMIGGAGLGYWMDPNWGPQSLIGFSIGVVIGGVAQLTCQFPALLRTGYRFVLDFDWRDSGIYQIGKLMVPAVIAASVVQVNVVINTIFAYGVGESAVSWLSYAFRLMQLPIGVFGVAVATVTLPALSRAAIDGIGPDFNQTLVKGLRLVAFLVLPCSIGLLLLADPIVSLLYERGRFDAVDRMQTAGALRAYGYGLLAYAWLKVLQPAFYAIDKRWLPMMVGLVSLAINIGFNSLFVYVLRWGHESLALTTSISAALNFLLLYLAMNRFVGSLDGGKMLGLLGKLFIAAATMSAVCWAALEWVFLDLEKMNVMVKCGALMATVGLAAAMYFLTTKILRVDEADEAFNMIMKKLRRSRKLTEKN